MTIDDKIESAPLFVKGLDINFNNVPTHFYFIGFMSYRDINIPLYNSEYSGSTYSLQTLKNNSIKQPEKWSIGLEKPKKMSDYIRKL